MTLLAIMALPFTLGAALAAFIAWPIAHRAGKRSVERDQAEIARILGGVAEPPPPPVLPAIDWARPAPADVALLAPTRVVAALTTPTAAHASLRVANTPKGYRGRHTGALVLAHVKAADTYIGRPRELVS